MMQESLDEMYLKWLYRQVAPIRLKNPARTYWFLLRRLYETEFVWLVANDDNRLEDGKGLRYEFFDDAQLIPNDPQWSDIRGCSALEMLIALSRRLSFAAGGASSDREWFWELLDNVGLRRMTDEYVSNVNYDANELIDQVLSRLIFRQYDPSGHGGLFPLREPRQDQRGVEIWYQMNAYLIERH